MVSVWTVELTGMSGRRTTDKYRGHRSSSKCSEGVGWNEGFCGSVGGLIYSRYHHRLPQHQSESVVEGDPVHRRDVKRRGDEVGVTTGKTF